jgi:nucleotide-binding universal stress UspA family protein
MADQAHVLVVANRTAGSAELLEAMRERAEEGPARFHLVVPASPRGASWAFDMHSGHDAAEHDLDGALERMRALGLEVDGEVGDPDPVAAVSDSSHAGGYDEVIVSTLPKHLSKWLKLDVSRKIAHATGLPVKHVEAHSRNEAPA